MWKTHSIVACATLLFGANLVAQETPAGEPEATAQEPRETTQEPPQELTREQEAEQFLANFNLQTGVGDIASVAKVELPEGWRWAAKTDGQRMLVAFGNPRDESVLGVAVPPDFATEGTFMVYSYSDEGHIEDEEPDYDELLESMTEDARARNEARKEDGYPTVELLGWAEPPHYDEATRKLYWAKKLQFEGNETPTLNYNVRVLGRTGTVEINGVGDIGQLRLVDQQCKQLLAATEFVEGQKYSDFDPQYDKVAAYGIGGLIAGKMALKAGLFAKLGVLLLKFLKPLLIGLAVVGGIIWKVVGGRRKPEPEARPVAGE